MDEVVAHIDFETRSPTDLRKAGVHRYVEDPNTGVWFFKWSITGTDATRVVNIGEAEHAPQHINRWSPGDPDPIELLEHIAMGGRVVAHNAIFERWVWNVVLRHTYGLTHWPELRIEQQSCTMSRAAANALPQDLDTLSVVLGFKEKKDRLGHALMMKMARPRRRNPDGTYSWWDAPEDIVRLSSYGSQDVRTETEADLKLPELTEHERAVWELDQVINDRGIPIDVVAVNRAVDVVLYAKRKADERMRELTGGYVRKCSEPKRIVEWLNGRGIKCETMRKGDKDELLVWADFAGDDTARKVIELRSEASKTSTAKYSAMLDCLCSDDRIRGQFNYHGAGPGRWAGRLVQPQNLVRVDPDKEAAMVAFTATTLGMDLSSKDIYELIEIAGYDPLPALAKSLRAMIKAGPGKKLIGGDFSNIEGRLNAWFAGEEWKLQAFRDYDAGVGPDMYKVTAGGLTGKHVDEITKIERQTLGKVPELACGYQGGVGAFMTMAYTQDPPVKVENIMPVVQANTPPADWDKMLAKFEGAFDKHGLQPEEWAAIKIVVTGWRSKNPKIVQSWWDLGDAAVEAVAYPGTVVPVYDGKVRYMCSEGWLYCQLPSGRIIAYCNPWIRETKEERVLFNGRWIDIDDFPTQNFMPYTAKELKDAGWEVSVRIKRTVWFMGVKEGQWREKYLYGGLQCENIVQGTARCLLDRALIRLERARYWIILHAHDEALSEVDRGFGSVQEYKHLMSVLPYFVAGLPLATAVWEDERYVK